MNAYADRIERAMSEFASRWTEQDKEIARALLVSHDLVSRRTTENEPTMRASRTLLFTIEEYLLTVSEEEGYESS